MDKSTTGCCFGFGTDWVWKFISGYEYVFFNGHGTISYLGRTEEEEERDDFFKDEKEDEQVVEDRGGIIFHPGFFFRDG